MVRSATIADVFTLLLLLRQLFTLEEDFHFCATRQLKGLELLLQQANGEILVAEIDGKLVGMVSGQLLVSTAEGEMALQIEDLVVAKPHQGKGIGPELLQKIGDWGRGCGANRMQLLADSANSQAVEFYHRQQWKKTQLVCLRKYHKS